MKYDNETNETRMYGFFYKELMEACKPLMEYSWFVDRIRAGKEKGLELEASVNSAVEQMPKEFLIRDCIVRNKAEEVQMCLTEYDEAEEMEKLKNEYLEQGIEQGVEETVRNLLEDGAITPEKADEIRRKYGVLS